MLVRRGPPSNSRVLIVKATKNSGAPFDDRGLACTVASLLDKLSVQDPSEMGDIVREANTGVKKHGKRATMSSKVIFLRRARHRVSGCARTCRRDLQKVSLGKTGVNAMKTGRRTSLG